MRGAHRDAQRIPSIAPVPPGVRRPFWSVMIPTYESDALLAECLGHVLAQAPGADEMQIQVVDDASPSGDAAAVVRDVGGSRVELYRQPVNVGAPRNFTTCVERAFGRWVHVLHADDIVLPGFYEKYRELIEAHPAALMAVGASHFADAAGVPFRRTSPLPVEDGWLVNALDALAIDRQVNFPAVVIARSTHERLGGYDPGLVHANDWELWTRIAAAGPVAAIDEPLAVYRQHPGSDTTRLRASTTYLRDPFEAAQIVQARLDDRGARRRLREVQLGWLATTALSIAADQVDQGERRRPLLNALWALRLHPDRATFTTALALARRVARRTLRLRPHP